MRIHLDINPFALGLLLALAWPLPASAEFMFDPKKTALSDVQYEQALSGDKEATRTSPSSLPPTAQSYRASGLVRSCHQGRRRPCQSRRHLARLDRA
jgi:hypothetical protein